MKKVYTLIMAFGVTWGVIAQSKVEVPQGVLKLNRLTKMSTFQPGSSAAKSGGPSTPVIAALGDTIYYEGFSAGLPGDWTNSGSTPAALWEYRGPSTNPDVTVGGRGPCSGGVPMDSETEADGFMIFDSNYLDDIGSTCGAGQGTGAAPSDHTGTLTTGAIDCSNFSAVNLSFYWDARNFDATMLVYASNDGGLNWTQVWDAGLGPNESSDPMSQALVNVSNIAGSQSDVRLRFEFDGEYYEWMIDDVLLTEGDPNDLGLSDTAYTYLNQVMSPVYTRIPKTQIGTIIHNARAYNLGGDAQTNVVLNVDVDNGSGSVFNSSSAPLGSLAAGEDSLLTVLNGFTPAFGTYTATFSVSADASDANPTDNTIQSRTYEITDTVYSRDAGVDMFGLDAAGYGRTGPYAFGNAFEFTAMDTIRSISIHIASNSTAGAPVVGIVYAFDGTTILGSTDLYLTQSSDIGNWITLPITELDGTNGQGIFTDEGVPVDSTFIFVLADDASAGNNQLKIAAATGPEDGLPGFGFLDGNLTPLFEVPNVRINMTSDPCNQIAVSEAINHVDCNGDGDGSIALTISGATNPTTFNWSNGASTATISSLSGGTYDVTITDAAGCVNEASYVVNEPAAPLSVTLTATNENCSASNGSVAATVGGGTGPYTYGWSDSQTGSTIGGLSSGNVDVTVTDDMGCTVSQSVSVGVTISTMTIVTFGAIDDDCNVGVGGITAAGSSSLSSTVDYLWSNGQTTAAATGLFQGTATVTVTDSLGCTATSTVTITGTPGVTASFSTVDADCGVSNGSATVNVSSGTSPYSYLWSNLSTDATATGLAAAGYGVLVTDANACSNNFAVAVNNPPANISVTSTATNVACNGEANGALTASASGTGSSYTYTWFEGSGITPISNVASATGLTAGVYVVSVVDNATCQTATSFTVTEPSELTASASNLSNVLCNGGSDGSVSATGMGGTTDYTYMWTGGQTTAVIQGLVAATYDVTVTDANGCTATASEVVTEPAAFSVNASATDISCNGLADGMVDVTASNGTAPYSYSWDNGLGTSSSATGLSANTYSVTATDANGCIATDSDVITEPDPFTITATATIDFTCFGANGGQATSAFTGGSGSPSYEWSNGTPSSGNPSLSGGVYDVTATDINGCTAVSNAVTITEAASAVMVTGVVTDETCETCNDGAIDLTVTGGSSPYTYNWTGGLTTEDLSGLADANYSVQVVDADGCSANRTFTVNNGPPAPNAIVESFGTNGVSIYPNPTNGMLNIKFSGASLDSYTFVVRNMIGQVVTNDVVNLSGNYIQSLDLNGYNSGVYFLTISNSNEKITERIVLK